MLVVNAFTVGLFAVRWQIIGTKLDLPAPFANYLKAIWASQFAGQFGPSLVMAEGTRFWLLRRYARKDRIAISQIVDRLSGQIILLTIAIVLSPFYIRYFSDKLDLPWGSVWAFSGLIIVLILCRYALWSKPFRLFFQHLKKQLNPFTNQKHYLLSLLIQCLLIFNFYGASVAVNAEIDLAAFFLLIPLIFVCLTVLPISIADWGTREVSAILILQNIGMDAEKVISMSLLIGMINLLSSLPGAFFLTENRKRTSPH